MAVGNILSHMLIPVPTDHPFAGILVKLQRADENIFSLEQEILRFFQESKYPVMPKPDDKRWEEALKYHRDELTIPKRFGVLAGEIVHHWRSCLDHIVWTFSSDDYRSTRESAIQFPILSEPPDADATKRLERQIGGVPDPSIARKLISDFQPYQLGADAMDHPFLIIHEMDRIDKHRELVIVHAIGNLVLPRYTPPEVVAAAAAYGEGKTIPRQYRKAVFKALNEQGKVLPQVAFAKFGKWENQFVAPSLRKLASAMEKAVSAFMTAL